MVIFAEKRNITSSKKKKKSRRRRLKQHALVVGNGIAIRQLGTNEAKKNGNDNQ